MIVSGLIATVLFNVLIKENKSLLFSFGLALFAIYFSQGVFAARNQIFSFLIFELELYSLHGLLIEGKKRHFWILLILALLLVMFHDTVFPLFFVMILPYLAEVIFSKIWKLENSYKLEYSNLSNQKYLIILMMVSFAIGFLTPIFGTAYTNLVNCMNGVSTEFIEELQPVNLLSELPLALLVFLTFAILCFTKTKVKIKDMLFALGFMVFSLIANRNLYFMYLIGTIYVGNILMTFLNTYLGEEKVQTKLSKLESLKLLIAVISILIVITSIKNFSKRLDTEYVDDLSYPIEETAYILKYLDYENMRLWTHFNFGSYLELNGIKVFVDSRSGMYTEQENEGCTVLEDWYKTNSGELKYNDTFEKYGITHVLVDKDELISQYIYDDPNYHLIYQSGIFSLYERK